MCPIACYSGTLCKGMGKVILNAANTAVASCWSNNGTASLFPKEFQQRQYIYSTSSMEMHPC